MSVSLAGKNVLVIGATGNVGQGAVYAFLSEGAKVAAVGRSAETLEKLKADLATHPINAAESKYSVSSQLRLDIGAIETEGQAKKTLEDAEKALGGPIDRSIPSCLLLALLTRLPDVLSNIGAISAPKKEQTLLKSSLAEFDHALLGHGIHCLVNASKVLVPHLQSRQSSSLTIVNGGSYKHCPMPMYWTATLKSSLTHSIAMCLHPETAASPLRVNEIAVSYLVTPIGGSMNQWACLAIRRRKLGQVFKAVAKASRPRTPSSTSLWTNNKLSLIVCSPPSALILCFEPIKPRS